MKSEEIKVPFGAKDSELKGWEYTIPEGMEAEIKDGKIIVREQESEDERIRKFLLDYFGIIKSTLSDDGIWKGFQIEKILAFLKKQREQEPKIYIPKFRNGDTIKLKGSSLTLTITNIEDGKYYGKGWSLDIVGADKSYEKEAGQEPAEWSEDDEKLLNIIISDIRRTQRSCGIGTDEWNIRLKAIKWLDSLRPQPHWKPSKEQMDALNEIINTLAASKHPHESDYLFNILNGLQKNLQKLL